MAIKDPMALLQEEMNKKAESSEFKPFFFSIKDGEKALIRPLLNMSQYALIHKHEFWNPGTKQWEARSICATDLELDCQFCIDAVSNKKLKADSRFVLPIYLYQVVDTKTGNTVTYKNQENEDVPVSGARLLEMKRSSDILAYLVEAYNDDEKHDITAYDFKIIRKGAGTETKYITSNKPPKPFNPDVEIPEAYRDPEQIIHLFTDACPPKLVGDDEKPAEPAAAPAKSTKGTVKSAPDF